MALYALDSEGVISAVEAPDRGFYRCLECGLPVQVRQGRRRRHFYHIKSAPSCRLYSKSEDHLLLQLQIQSLFPKGEVLVERPFLPISRMADACLERRRIVFEVQCSLLSLAEAETRVRDYASVGFSIVWLLDDRLFNRRVLKPAEEFLRTQLCYYIRFRRTTSSHFYDQFEICSNQKRLRKGSFFKINLTKFRRTPLHLPQGQFPKQVLNRHQHPYFFLGDLMHKALLSSNILSLQSAMITWKRLEESVPLAPSPWKLWAKKTVLEPFWHLFEVLLEITDS